MGKGNHLYKTVRTIDDYITSDDNHLIEWANAGDQKAFALLVQRYTQMVFGVALRILNDKAEAEDVSQDVFMILVNSLRDWDETRDVKFSSWLYRVAFNKAIDFKRKQKMPLVDMQDDLIEADQKDAFQIIFEQQISKQLRDILDQLPSAQRDALYLHYFKEMTVSEVSTAMGKTEQSIRSLLKRGKMMLRETVPATI